MTDYIEVLHYGVLIRSATVSLRLEYPYFGQCLSQHVDFRSRVLEHH